MITINKHVLREPTPGCREYSEYTYYTAEINGESLMQHDKLLTCGSETEIKAALFDYIMYHGCFIVDTKEISE